MAKKTKCAICGLDLEGGAEKLIKKDLEKNLADLAKLEKSLELLKPNQVKGFYKTKDGKNLIKLRNTKGEVENKLRKFENPLVKDQVSYWMHNPRLLTEDIKVTVHLECYQKVKKKYPNFDQPTQDKKEFPIIENDIVKLKTDKEFIKLKRM